MITVGFAVEIGAALLAGIGTYFSTEGYKGDIEVQDVVEVEAMIKARFFIPIVLDTEKD